MRHWALASLAAVGASATAASSRCQTSPWSAWSACSTTCGEGTQSHTRSLLGACSSSVALVKTRTCRHRLPCVDEQRRLVTGAPAECRDTQSSDFHSAGECAEPRTGMPAAPTFAVSDALVSDKYRCLPKCGWHFGVTEGDGSWRWSCARDASLYCNDGRADVRADFRRCCPVSCNAVSRSCASALGCAIAPEGARHNSIEIGGLELCCPTGWVQVVGGTCQEPTSGASCFLYGGAPSATPCPSVQAFSPNVLPTATQRSAAVAAAQHRAANAASADIEAALGLDPAAVAPAASSAPELRPAGVVPLPAHTEMIPPATSRMGNLCSHLRCRAELHRCSKYTTDATLRVLGTHFDPRQCTGIQHYTVRVTHDNRESSCGDATGGSVCGVGAVTGDQTRCECRPNYINGDWSAWGDWGACSRTCGAGTKQRVRACTNPAPSWGGKSCGADGAWKQWKAHDGSGAALGKGRQRGANGALEQADCNERPCPEHGAWQPWGAWSTCTKSCDGGSRSRSRACSAPLHGGIGCSGAAAETGTCSTQPCPVDGGWTSWGSFGVCLTTCGPGTKVRSRTCTNPAPAAGGKPCYGQDANGVAYEHVACAHRPCPVHGSWSKWGSWSECSTSCGRGKATRSRTCSGPEHGGTKCSGARIEHRDCDADVPCPVDGAYGSWGKWSKCSTTCGGGLQTRKRTCSEPRHGGAACTGDPREEVSCNAHPCDGYTAHRDELVGRCAEVLRHLQGGDFGTVNHFTAQRACNAAGDDCFGYQLDMEDDKYGGAYLMKATAWQHGCAGPVGKCSSGWCFFEKGGARPQLPDALARPRPHQPYVPLGSYKSIVGDCTGTHDLDRLGSHHRSLLKDKCEKACDGAPSCVGFSYSREEAYCLLKGPVAKMETRHVRFNVGSSIGRCGKRFGTCPATGWCYFNKEAPVEAADPHACCDRQCAATYAANALDLAALARRALCKFGCRASAGTLSVSKHLASGSYCGRDDSLLATDAFARYEQTSVARHGGATEPASSFCAMGVLYRDVCSGDDGDGGDH